MSVKIKYEDVLLSIIGIILLGAGALGLGYAVLGYVVSEYLGAIPPMLPEETTGGTYAISGGISIFIIALSYFVIDEAIGAGKERNKKFRGRIKTFTFGVALLGIGEFGLALAVGLYVESIRMDEPSIMNYGFPIGALSIPFIMFALFLFNKTFRGRTAVGKTISRD